MCLDSLIILRIEWNSYVSYLRGKQWKYWRLKFYNLCCVLCVVCCVVCCVVLCCWSCVLLSCVLLCCVLCCVLCVRPSSSSVRPPSRPSVAVVRRRRPLSVRPSRPSVAVVRRRPSSSTCKSKAACKFSKKLVFLVHFKPWDLSRKMRREFLTEFSSGIIDFENKIISIVQKQWKFRISVPMSYIAFLEATLHRRNVSRSIYFWINHDVMRRDRYIFEQNMT